MRIPSTSKIMPSNQTLEKQHAARSFRISKEDLPLYCPRKDMSLWNTHPRVYLPISNGQDASCPYCGTVYRLNETKPLADRDISEK